MRVLNTFDLTVLIVEDIKTNSLRSNCPDNSTGGNEGHCKIYFPISRPQISI